MDLAREESPIDFVALLSDERFKHAITILQSAQHELSPAKERLDELAQDLARLLDEIEQFETIVYCGKAAACWLGDVLRVLAGSMMWETGFPRTGKRTRISKDEFWKDPSSAARGALNLDSADGPKKWKDRSGCSIMAILMRKADEAKKANEPGKNS